MTPGSTQARRVRGLVVISAFVGAILTFGSSGCSSSSGGGGGTPGNDASTGSGNDAGNDTSTGADSASGGDSSAPQDSSAADSSTGADSSSGVDSAADTGADGAGVGPSEGGANDGGEGGAACGPGVATCSSAVFCGVSATACVIPTCTAGCCGTSNAAADTPCTNGGGSVCDGNGTCVACVMVSDCPAQTSVCKLAACTAHVCGTTNAALGTPCTDNGGTVCNSGVCSVAHCADGIKDGDETDVDCGGATCSPCADGKTCLVKGDCVDKVCAGSPLTCAVPTCVDGVQNGNETDVDCGGGTCPACADAKMCVAGTDCVDKICSGTPPVCAASTCNDGVENGNETDVDCGGNDSCPRCANGKDCDAKTDCTSNVCDTTIDTCVECTLSTQCTTAPGVDGCFDATHLFVGTCTTDACGYTSGTPCMNGCWQNVCNTTGPSFDGDAVAPPGTLDKEANLNASSGTEAAGSAITVTVDLTPHNAIASLTLNYTTDDFATTNAVTCTLSGTSGNDDVWTATIPAQVATTTVRFYYEAVDYQANDLYLPGNNVNYTYVAN